MDAPPTGQLVGKIAVVTGGSRGIGRATARPVPDLVTSTRSGDFEDLTTGRVIGRGLRPVLRGDARRSRRMRLTVSVRGA